MYATFVLKAKEKKCILLLTQKFKSKRACSWEIHQMSAKDHHSILVVKPQT